MFLAVWLLSCLLCLLKASVASSYLEFLILTHVTFRMMESLLKSQLGIGKSVANCNSRCGVKVLGSGDAMKRLHFVSSVFVLLLIFVFEYRSLECSDFNAQCIWKSRNFFFVANRRYVIKGYPRGAMSNIMSPFHCSHFIFPSYRFLFVPLIRCLPLLNDAVSNVYSYLLFLASNMCSVASPLISITLIYSIS